MKIINQKFFTKIKLILIIFCINILAIIHVFSQTDRKFEEKENSPNEYTEESSTSTDYLMLVIFFSVNIAIALIALANKKKALRKVVPKQLVEKWEFNSNIREFVKFSDNIELFGNTVNMSIKQVYDIILICEELFVEIVQKVYNEEKSKKIIVQLDYNIKRVKVEITYPGKVFNPFEASKFDVTKPIEEIDVEGLSMHIVKHYISDYKYSYIENKNILEIIINSKNKNNLN